MLYYTVFIFFSWIVTFYLSKHYNKYSLRWMFFISFIILLISINLFAFSSEIYLEYKLDTFDLDGSGGFTPDEETLEQQKYMRAYTSGVGRQVAILLSPIISLTSAFLYILIFKLYVKVSKIG